MSIDDQLQQAQRQLARSRPHQRPALYRKIDKLQARLERQQIDSAIDNLELTYYETTDPQDKHPAGERAGT